MSARIAVIEDVPALVPLFLEMVQHDTGDVSVCEDEMSARLFAWFNNRNGASLVVAERQAQLVGHATLLPHFPAGDLQPSWFVKGVYVAASARGKGIGSTLLKTCAGLVQSRGGLSLDITVNSDNHEAVSFYLNLGGTDSNKRYLRWTADELTILAGGK